MNDIRIIDTHCHLDLLENSVDQSLLDAKDVNVDRVITISVDAKSLDFVDETSKENETVYGSLGIHPHDAVEFNESVAEKITELISKNSKKL